MTELYEHLEEEDDDASSVTEEWEVFKRVTLASMGKDIFFSQSPTRTFLGLRYALRNVLERVTGRVTKL